MPVPSESPSSTCARALLQGDEQRVCPVGTHRRLADPSAVLEEAQLSAFRSTRIRGRDGAPASFLDSPCTRADHGRLPWGGRPCGRCAAGFWAVTRGLLATRRADRTAIVMPAMFALGWQVIGNLTGGDVRGPA